MAQGFSSLPLQCFCKVRYLPFVPTRAPPFVRDLPFCARRPRGDPLALSPSTPSTSSHEFEEEYKREIRAITNFFFLSLLFVFTPGNFSLPGPKVVGELIDVGTTSKGK